MEVRTFTGRQTRKAGFYNFNEKESDKLNQSHQTTKDDLEEDLIVGRKQINPRRSSKTLNQSLLNTNGSYDQSYKKNNNEYLDDIEINDNSNNINELFNKNNIHQKQKPKSFLVSEANPEKSKIKNISHFTEENNPFLIKSLQFNARKPKLNFDINEDFDNSNVTFRSEASIRPTSDNYHLFEYPRNDFYLKYFETIKSNTIDFLEKTSPIGTMIRSNIRIEKGLITEYTLLLEDFNEINDNGLITTKRKIATTGIFFWLYSFDNDKQKHGKNEKKIPIKIGKLYSNFTRSKYVLIGGLNEKSSIQTFYQDMSEAEIENEENSNKLYLYDELIDDGYKFFDLEYINKVIGNSKPKDIILNLNLNRNEDEDVNSGQKRIKRINKQIKLITNKPVYDPETKTYKLDFRNRAKLPSTNNLQLIDENNPSKILLQLGKMDERHYSLDFCYPFNMFSAFGFAISCLSRS